jgi:tRNA-(ms[2]io[6]A)-hydroxylase
MTGFIQKEQAMQIHEFLKCATPQAWLEVAVSQELNLLLIDHAHCEKKAAATALGLIYRYADKQNLLVKMSRLAREELLHFEQVLKFLEKKEITFQNIDSGRYASRLHQYITQHEPNKLIDTLIVGALIEARSCERFQLLSHHVDSDLALFYKRLYIAEERHFYDYLNLAKEYSPYHIEERINFFLNIEAELISTPDEHFRFHSGVPVLISSNSVPSSMRSPIV